MSIHGWSLTALARPGITTNNWGLPTNCYYCTAAALQGVNCADLSKRREMMQYNNGSMDDFAALFAAKPLHKELQYRRDVEAYLLAQLGFHDAVALGYQRANKTGHMIVVFKSYTR